jgi:hypothetical protein
MEACGRERTLRGHRGSGVKRIAFAGEDKRHVRERRKIARRADGSLRRDDRRDTLVEHRYEKIDDLEAHAGVAAGKRVRAQEHGRPSRVERKRVADAARVAAHEIALERHRVFGRTRHVFQTTKACRHSIDALAGRDRFFNQIARCFDPRATLRIQDDLGAVARNGRYLGKRKIRTVDGDGLLWRHGRTIRAGPGPTRLTRGFVALVKCERDRIGERARRLALQSAVRRLVARTIRHDRHPETKLCAFVEASLGAADRTKFAG